MTLPLFLARLIRPFTAATSAPLTSPASGSASTAMAGAAGSQVATLAAGCFWGVEHAFRKEFGDGKGLLDARVGFMGGDLKNPSYRRVCAGDTGHAESLHISFDPARLPYGRLIEFFYRMHDPTTSNRQGNDAGTHYRSAIFFHDEGQERVARDVTRRVDERWWKGAVKTQILPAGEWWDAEDYHQKYMEKNEDANGGRYIGYECPSHYPRPFPPLD